MGNLEGKWGIEKREVKGEIIADHRPLTTDYRQNKNKHKGKKMKQEEQKQQQACGLYVAPLLEVVHLQVERGFADSLTPTGNINLSMEDLTPGSDPLEERLDEGYFGGSESSWY